MSLLSFVTFVCVNRENEAAVTCAYLLPFTLLSFVCGLCVLVCCE